ncbi:hypothetical protein [Peredibacter starrii]|uniref:Uncharacterized protein n=1 Tax=Peredibacter starrii TaxID=28202 RepID=A0AAX4HQ11_9BACT|nr:hypothetical protein [Peredibacter starrii]WPU65359.1 hypothetical protein SOO65_01210 [Peredibacter starrii]
MIKIVLASLFLASAAHAYVPTVESLFRHGSNPDVTGNGISLTMVVKKMGEEKTPATTQDASLVQDSRPEDFYKIFITHNPNDSLKIAQTRYKNATFSESSLEHKIYYPNFTSYTVKTDIEQLERGLFFSLINSLTLNNGSHMVNYLKQLGVPVRLNNELINREKVEFLADYKRYLVTIAKDRNAKKTEVNPMRPDDREARERAERIMNESMYTDTKQVKLSRDDGQIAWVVNAGPFEAVFAYKSRDLQKIRYKSQAGELEMVCKDYWLANGTHAMPRYILIKSLNGQSYQVEITNLRHYVEKEADLVRRLNNWDQILKGKESSELRPEFLL